MTINTADLTTQVIDGTGVFDALMHTVKLHLQEEFDASRISGSDYTTAYIQLMGTAMQVAVQYAVSKPESDAKVAEMVATLPHTISRSQADANKSKQELQLLWEKTMTERANTQEMILAGYREDGAYVPTDAITVLGVVGKQKALYQNQADGYIKDAKVKAAKLFADAAMLQLNTNDTYNTSTNGFSDTNINAVMSAVKASVI